MILAFGTWSRSSNGSAIALVLLLLFCASAPANDLAAKLALCAGCHGDAGLPARPDVPILWGQEFYYLYVQLKDYKAGRRENAEMAAIVATMSKTEMQELAQHFAGQKWPSTGFSSEDADAARGETASVAGLCVQCHLGGYEGNSRIPRLAGQQVQYLERTMMDFKNKVRMNSPAKASLMAAYEDVDVTALARYLAGF